MKIFRFYHFLIISFIVAGGQMAWAASEDDSAWQFSLGGGFAFYESDEEVESGQLYQLKLGYSPNTRWTFEGGVGLLPYLNNNSSSSFQLEDEVLGVNFALDALYHLNSDLDRTIDPFISLGGGGLLYDESLEHGSFDPYAALGGGLMYHCPRKSNWFIRADYRLLMVDSDTEWNHHALFSIGYRWGDRVESGGDSDRLGLDRGKDTGLTKIFFAFDSSVLDATAQDALKENAKWLNANADEPITIEGHCDERGTDEYNYALGQQRAQSVFDYLKSLGVSTKRLRTVSYGEEIPLDPEHNESAWAKNRRAEFKYTD